MTARTIARLEALEKEQRAQAAHDITVIMKDGQRQRMPAENAILLLTADHADTVQAFSADDIGGTGCGCLLDLMNDLLTA